MPAAPEADTPPHRYDAAFAAEIETRWQDRWASSGIYETPSPATSGGPAGGDAAGRKLFVMDMFPYPSGSGLHVGHPLGYIATDVYVRFKRMTGFNVLYTMGFDAFGLPAEEHARQTGQHPRVNTEANIANMRRQLDRLGLGHDKRRGIATTDVGLLPLDPVDLPADLQLLVRSRLQAGPTDLGAGRRVQNLAPECHPTTGFRLVFASGLVRSCGSMGSRGGPPSLDRQLSAGLRG